MLAYQFNLPVDENAVRELQTDEKSRREPRFEAVEQINRELGRGRAGEDWFLFVCRKSSDGLTLIAVSRKWELDPETVEAALRDFFRETDIRAWKCQATDFHEVTLTSLCSAMKMGEERDLINVDYRFYHEMGLKAAREFFMPDGGRDGCQIVETIPAENLGTKDDALRRAQLLLGHRSLTEELSRIYCEENRRTFKAHPVHYRIRAKSRQAAKTLVDLLVSALYENGRLPGKRETYMSDFDFGCMRKKTLHDILAQTRRSTVVMELFGESAPRVTRGIRRSDEDFEDYLVEEFRKQQDETLFLFVDIANRPDKKRERFLQRLFGEADIITIREGSGGTREARDCLQEMARMRGQEPFSEEELEIAVPEGVYTLTEAEGVFHKLSRERALRDDYPAYCNLRIMEGKKQGRKVKVGTSKKKASERLQKLVGLQDVKELVRQIVAANRMQKLRKKMGMKASSNALHMVFTGNPGSAKTTVARLLAGILKEEGVSATGAFVECGRSNLVGRYVGWTAKIVRQKFEEASGGVLFIDEAYALVDSSKSFGDEAINTIVQEMENRRDDVMVIFAGYPEKMREFLNSNEGLRSRIAFHLDFPDYTADELVEILQVMAKERDLELAPATMEKCRAIFEDAAKQEDFGNGRYVRNILDAAVIRQADRLLAEQEQYPITKQMAQNLTVEDFAPMENHKKAKRCERAAGFRVAVEGDERG